ncbi:MAG: DUF502 domain-containing protein [Endomicrobium sp.]|jgi:uncharacterized membrane protein|nr:DUF502 domain-containing protein [Endomicrobium sp.]
MEKEKQSKKSIKEKLGILIKTYLITGLVVIIPLWLTYFIVAILFKWVSGFAFPIVYYFISDKYWVHVIARISSFFISIISIIILGFITNRVFGKSALNSIEKLIEKLPILGTVHSAAKQFVNFIFGNDSTKNFKKVIFVPYPNKGVYSVAFLTGNQIIKGEKYLCAFMPTTPNPTTGFLLLFKEEEIIYTEYTVEQAFQFIISVGVICMNKNDKKIELKEEIEEIKEINNDL